MTKKFNYSLVFAFWLVIVTFLATGCVDNSSSPATAEPPQLSLEERAEQIAQKEGITLTGKDVQYDMVNNLGKKFIVYGEAELSTYYNYGFTNEQSYFSIQVTPVDGNYSDSWHLYISREHGKKLFDDLKSKGKLNVISICIIPENVYQDSQGNMAGVDYIYW